MRVGVGVCVRAPYSIKHLIKKERYINFFYKTKILAHETNWLEREGVSREDDTVEKMVPSGIYVRLIEKSKEY